MEKVLVVNKAICNECQQEIVSQYRHDFVTCLCGETSVDGGNDYIRRVGGNYTDTSLYTDDPHSELRKFITRGGRGINGDQPLTYVTLDKINDNWLKNLIEYEEEHRPHNGWFRFYKAERKYRKVNNLTVKEG